MRSFRFALPLLCLGFSLALAGGVARADYEADAKVLVSVRTTLHAPGATPAANLAKAQAIIAGVNDNVPFQISLVREIANFQRSDMGDSKAALATIEAGLAKFPDAPDRLMLVGYKIDVLAQEDPDAAVVYAKSQWPAAQKADPQFLYWVTQPYGTALHASGDDAGAAALLQSVWTSNLLNAGNYKGNWMAGQLAKAQSDSGQGAAALSTAKMGWMLAAFDTDAINDATKTLLSTWAATDAGGKNSDVFVKAQTDASAPNPLKDVPLPTIAPEVLSEQMIKAGGGASDARITVLLVSGQPRRAMLAARSMMVDHPDSPEGVAQVCRVFKATDLNLVRANGFVAWVKKPDGPNPILAFLKEHPATEAATPAP